MVAMQRRAAKEGVNLDFTESPLFPRGPSAETIRSPFIWLLDLPRPLRGDDGAYEAA